MHYWVDYANSEVYFVAVGEINEYRQREVSSRFSSTNDCMKIDGLYI